MTSRSKEWEANRLKAIRSRESREKMSRAKKGKTPANLKEAQKLAWASNRKETLTYPGIHAWVKRNWGKANCCELCGKTGLSGQAVHWANKDHKYSRNREDWFMVCRPCHAAYDMQHNGLTFKNHRAGCTHCPRGHEYTPENTYVINGSRRCRACYREKAEEKRRLIGIPERGKRTHCKRGHEYTHENTKVRRGVRVCVACTRQGNAERTARFRNKRREVSVI